MRVQKLPGNSLGVGGGGGGGEEKEVVCVAYSTNL